MEIFWNTIAAYNAATWPAQIVFTGIATLLLLLLCLRPTNTVRIAMKSFMAMLNFLDCRSLLHDLLPTARISRHVSTLLGHHGWNLDL